MIRNIRIIRYILSGGVAVFVNVGTLYVLTDIFHVWYLFSAIISFIFGMVASYLLQKFFTFRNNSMNKIHTQFSIFVFYNLVMLGANTLLMYLFVDIFRFWYLFSQIFITVFMAFINYMFFSKFIFNNDK